MNRFTKLLITALICISLLTGCSGKSTTSSSISLTATPTGSSSTTVSDPSASVSESTSRLSSDFGTTDEYDGKIPSDATTITLNSSSATIKGDGASADGGLITISSSGVYVISGTLEDGQIIVDADKKADIQLILNGASITCSNSSPIYIKKADNVILSLQKGTENTLIDTANYTFSDASTDEPNATLYCKSDLVINGEGQLTVEANYKNGITGKDTLKITQATINVTSVNNGIIGRDLLAIKDANITLTTTGAGLKSTNDEDSAKGFLDIINGTITIDSTDDSLNSNNGIAIAGGTLNLSSGDDGIHADNVINITGGTITVNKSYEGIESTLINITDGTIHLASSDDGINISSKKNDTSTTGGQDSFNAISGDSLNVSGGYVYVNADGDGLDSNNSVTISGGTVIVDGPVENDNAALDYNGTFKITGGYLIAAGSSGMAQTTSDTSTQNSIAVYFTDSQAAESLVHVEDSKGNDIATFSPAKAYQFFIVSSGSITDGESYTVSYGGSSTGTSTDGLFTGGSYSGGTKLGQAEVSSNVTTIGTPSGNGMGGGFGGGNNGGNHGAPGGPGNNGGLRN